MVERTTYAGLVNENYLNKEVTLFGWVDRRRDLGKLLFVDLRDREGIVQLSFGEQTPKDVFETARTLRNEFVIKVKGTVVKREDGQENANLKSGHVEVNVSYLEVLNESKNLPFEIRDDVDANEETLLKYRYLDLRRPRMQRGIILRSKILQAVHEYYDQNGFIDIETPNLAKSTPEGARDYLVPSRVYPGHFYALPQSPQLFKQLLMGAGFDRYYQIARCFRDEDLRGDRQPEFTQIDVETTFLTQHDIMDSTEGMLKNVMKKALNVDIETPFPRITWKESMDRFGTDQPDARFKMEIQDVTEIVKGAHVADQAFESTENTIMARAISVPNAAESFSRSDMEREEQYVERFGVKRLVWVKVKDGSFTGAGAKMLQPCYEELTKALDASEGSLVLMVIDRFKVVCDSLSYLRVQMANKMNMIPENTFKYLWVIDWPLFEYDEGDKRWVAAHHPFTAPNVGDEHYLEEGEDPHKAHAQSYDIILNGLELGGGSIRNHNKKVQENMFRALGFTMERAYEQFGFLLNALDMGFPPHGGIALGLDRFARLLAGSDNIREVIAFPKNSKATEPMTNAPAKVSEAQLKELGIETTTKE